MALPVLYRTPEDFMLDQIEAIRAGGSRITDFSTGSAARNLLDGTSAALSHLSLLVNQFQNDSFIQTATGDALDTKAADYQVDRNAATSATGTIRITRASSGSSVTIPAGWGALQTRPTPGVATAGFITLADAVFGNTDLHIDVTAEAIDPGVQGNILDGTILLPTNPVSGFVTDGGFVAHGNFTQGVDAETDDAFRTRIKVTVQGRGKANSQTFIAAALAVPGVTSAAVLRAGDTRTAGGTVAAEHAELYYAGGAGLSAVQSAVDTVAQLNQTVTAIAAASVRSIVAVTVFCLAGTDTTALAATVKTALQDVFAAAGVGGIVYLSAAIEALHAIPDVVSITVPPAQFRKNADAPGTTGNVDPGDDQYAALATGDITVTVTTL